MSDLFGALVEGVTSIATTAMNNSAVDSANRANRAFQLAQQESMNQYNTMQWNRQNEYNSPIAAMARFKAAGLNPNLIYGAGSSSATFATPPAPAVRAEYVQQAHPPIDGGGIVSRMIRDYNDSRMTDANVDNLSKQGDNTEALTRKIMAMLPHDVDNVDSSTAKNAAEAANIPFMAQHSADALDASASKARADAQLALDQDDRQAVELDLKKQTTAMTLQTAVQSILDSRMSRAKSQAEINYIQAQKKLADSDNLIKGLDATMIKQGVAPGTNYWLQNLENLFSGGAYKRSLNSPPVTPATPQLREAIKNFRYKP